MANENLLSAARLIFASKPIKAVAWLPTSTTDRAKVESELQGVRKPLPNSAWALGLVTVCREAYGTVAPPPLPTSSLAAIWRQDGVFVRNLSNFTTRDEAWAAGFRWIAVQLDHVPYAAENERELAKLRPELEAKGWKIVGWADAGNETDPATDAIKATGFVRRLQLDGWLAGMELWAEETMAWKSAAFIRAWQGAGSPSPVGVSCSSSDTANFGRSFDYASWLAVAGACVAPQVYSATYPNVSVGAMLGSFAKAGVPESRLAPTFDVIDGSGPFGSYQTWPGPRSLWTGDDSRAATWPRLAR